MAEFTSVFIVEGKPREAEGIVKVIKENRHDALQAARDCLDQGLPFSFPSSVTAAFIWLKSSH
jgi:hypothetical protein